MRTRMEIRNSIKVKGIEKTKCIFKTTPTKLSAKVHRNRKLSISSF